MKKLNIEYEMLNTLIRKNILRVNINFFEVYFYSYQVQEILYILDYGQPDVVFMSIEEFNKMRGENG